MLPARKKPGSLKAASAFERAIARSKDAFARAGERAAQRRRPVRIGFLIDSTASREASWEEAQVIQADIFRKVGSISDLRVRLVHFGGEDINDMGWREDPKAIAAEMAKVRCRRGLTQIISGLRYYSWELGPETSADAVILIGDCFEENLEDIEIIGAELKEKKIRVFAFQEGDDWTAMQAFRRLSELTGGAYAKLGDALPLGALCEGVARLAAGGAKALKALPNKDVQRLLLQAPEQSKIQRKK